MENFWLKQFLDFKWRIELELWHILPKLRSLRLLIILLKTEKPNCFIQWFVGYFLRRMVLYGLSFYTIGFLLIFSITSFRKVNTKGFPFLKRDLESRLRKRSRIRFVPHVTKFSLYLSFTVS